MLVPKEIYQPDQICDHHFLSYAHDHAPGVFQLGNGKRKRKIFDTCSGILDPTISKIHLFDFYIYHPDQIGAENICAELAGQGYRIAVREGALGEEWLCLVSIEMLPSLENLTRAEALIQEQVDFYRGEYDGWETSIVPEE